MTAVASSADWLLVGYWRRQCGDQCEWVLWEEGRRPSQAGQNPLTASTFANYSRGSPLDATFASSLRRAYYAAISLMDDSIGRTMAVLEELELEKDTVVIFHADHGCVHSVGFDFFVVVLRCPDLLLNNEW